jgi:hypothetical protein
LLEQAHGLAYQIAGEGAPTELQELAWPIAHAIVELRRVRHTRDEYLSRALTIPPAMCTGASPGDGLGSAESLSRDLRTLLALDRYERRARSRQRKAVCGFIRKAKELTHWNGDTNEPTVALRNLSRRGKP